MEQVLRFIEKLVPKKVYRFFQPFYHHFLAYFAAVIYRFPSRNLKVIGVTGTTGKSTVVHMITSILEEAGNKVISVSSLRLKVGEREAKDQLKRTMPGRFVVQKLLKEGVNSGCKYAVLEVTSQGIEQFRHKGINFSVAVLTNVAPEHIEAHGGFENYRNAKAKLFKVSKVHVLNKDDSSFEFFQKISFDSAHDKPAPKKIFYSKNDLPTDLKLKLPGEFNKENSAAAWVTARELGITEDVIKRALEKVDSIPGRMEFVQKEPFAVVVDYAHTPDALRKVYDTLREHKAQEPEHKLICVLGAAGGGRDKWKRPEMGRIAKEFCDEIILTNEDPYDENPEKILEDIEKGITSPPNPLSLVRRGGEKRDINLSSGGEVDHKLIIDRREAIREALKSAGPGDTVVITGKGAEQWIMGPNGSKIPWDDRVVAKEELQKL